MNSDFEKWLEQTFRRAYPHQILGGYAIKIAPIDNMIALDANQARRLAEYVVSLSSSCSVCGYPGMETERCDTCAGVNADDMIRECALDIIPELTDEEIEASMNRILKASGVTK